MADQTGKPVSSSNSTYPPRNAHNPKTTPSKGTTAKPESPTTARELDFDDDVQETGLINESGETTAVSREEVGPPKPPRPRDQAEATLREAFPSIDGAVVKAVLAASGGQVEPAFNALLGMSDPNAQEVPPPPPKKSPPKTSRSQIESDELYARQLAEHYSGAAAHNQNAGRGAPVQNTRRPTGLKPNEMYDDKEHSFIDDDLPVIKENLRKGFLETQSKVNQWVSDLRKKLDGEPEDEFTNRPANQGSSSSQYPRRSGEYGRRSADRERYDADPKVLGDDFGALELRDDKDHPPRTSSRPSANPNLFKSTGTPPPNGQRRVSFQEGPPEEIGEPKYTAPHQVARQPSPAGGAKSKWQPLNVAEPSPVTNHDPFSLGDSDDERDKTKDIKDEERERLQKAAAEAMGDDIGEKPKPTAAGEEPKK
ncbi:MAG: ubiquitin-binding protein cue5 [Vezdaea aestivalis]|nr:MAG: ubiquitin-binding protein cue5 [Vezdaea aestivalis]